ncbi:putative acid phosphatase [Trypanosoma cruzi]|nr:putative acid phosphatase [Trypanosoma cruzi]
MQVQPAFVGENGPSDATLTVATPMTGLRLVSRNIAKPWGDSSPTGHVANPREPQVPNFETQVLPPIVWVRPGSWGSSKGSSLLKGGDRSLTAPTPSRTRRIEALSFIRGWKRRMTTYRRADLTLRSPAAFLQNENARSPGANSSWRRPAPNHRNERHASALERRSKPRGRRRRRAGEKPPPLGEVLQMDLSRVKIRPKMALQKNRVRRVA